MGSPKKTPAIQFGDGRVLVNPSLQELAHAAGIWKGCPGQKVDFIIVGAGPAGIAAAVYAASEGLATLVLDKFGPGGQAGGSSKIENFIGFPSGLSGAELATRGVLQMLKFGAKMAAPVSVQRLIPAQGPGDCHTVQLDCGTVVKAPVPRFMFRCCSPILACFVHFYRSATRARCWRYQVACRVTTSGFRTSFTVFDTRFLSTRCS